MASAIDSLKREHRAIESAIAALDQATARMRQGAVVPVPQLEAFIDFIRRFADGCHHQKEEQLLFPKMQQHGFPSGVGPIACMLGEHERGRAFVRAMVDALKSIGAGEAAATEAFCAAANGYANLLREHIVKEDSVLFVMAEKFVGDDMTSLEQPFADAQAQLGPGKYDEYEVWAHGLVHA